jgi:hypothetical protein
MRHNGSGRQSLERPLTWQELTASLAGHILNLSRISSRGRSCRTEMRRWARELDRLGRSSPKSGRCQEVQGDR